MKSGIYCIKNDVNDKVYVGKAKLNPEARLGLAYCRMNCWEWDEYMGKKPANFEENKFEALMPYLKKIESTIGKNNCSKYWWVFEIGKTEEEWAQWYYVDRYKIKNNP